MLGRSISFSVDKLAAQIGSEKLALAPVSRPGLRPADLVLFLPGGVTSISGIAHSEEDDLLFKNLKHRLCDYSTGLKLTSKGALVQCQTHLPCISLGPGCADPGPRQHYTGHGLPYARCLSLRT